MAIYVERPPGPDGTSRSRTFSADSWDIGRTGNLELRKGGVVIAEILTGDWLLAEGVPES